MREIIKTVKDFKIIPGNFKSSGAFDLISVDEDTFKAELKLVDESELADYTAGGCVEIFGVNNIGLIYFETKIISIDGRILTLNLNSDYSIIQRREYSRVELNQGKIILKDLAPDTIQKVLDISAGGVKIISKEPLEIDKHYAVQIILSNNMTIECAIQPIRISTEEENGNKYFVISNKFVDLENSDRIVLVQYAFKVKMEEQSKENG